VRRKVGECPADVDSSGDLPIGAVQRACLFKEDAQDPGGIGGLVAVKIVA
jgi:hypothetical protein